jgi:hypothetical protein
VLVSETHVFLAPRPHFCSLVATGNTMAEESLSKQRHISVRKRDSFRPATEIIAVRITMTTLSVTCISEFSADITELALFFKKFVVEPVHYHRVSGDCFTQCVLPLTMSRPSVRLNLYNNSNHMNGFARNLVFVKITQICQYTTILFTVQQIRWICMYIFGHIFTLPVKPPGSENRNHSIDPPSVPREKQNKYRTRKSLLLLDCI